MRAQIFGFKMLSMMLLALASLLALPACQTNPATGQQTFTAFMSPAQEQATGQQMHAQTLAEFGEVADPALQNWVRALGQKLVAVSETPNERYQFTVLDSDVVNAMAAPGGYVYITRGLLALMNDEAEAGGVLGHEIGHIVARHTAQRYSQGVLASLGVGAAAILTGSQELAKVANTGSQLVLSSYSRSHEFESDAIGLRYLQRMGYDPYGSARMLTSLERNADLRKRVAGAGAGSSTNDFFASHPRDEDRIKLAKQLADQGPRLPNPYQGRDALLDAVDGLPYGSSAEQGFVRGSSFIHTKLGLRFDAPYGFKLTNSSKQVIATNGQGVAIIFDGDTTRRLPANSLAAYLRETWAKGATLTNMEEITINSMPAVTATARGNNGGRQVDVRFIAIRFDSEQIFRFTFVTPPNLTGQFAEALQRTTYSFNKLTAAERATVGQRRIRVVTVKPGDTMASMARRMDVDELPLETFAVINALAENAPLTVGQRVKLVVTDAR